MDNVIYLADYQKLKEAAEEALSDQEDANRETDMILGSFMLQLHHLWDEYMDMGFTTEEEMEMVLAMVVRQRRDGFYPHLEDPT